MNNDLPISRNVIAFPAAPTARAAESEAADSGQDNSRLRSGGLWLSQIPDCRTDSDTIVHECLPRRLNCGKCERNPMNTRVG